jgi:hypothetical protein
MKLEFSQKIFENYRNIKFRENPFSGSRVVPCGRSDGQTNRQTDRHDEAIKLDEDLIHMSLLGSGPEISHVTHYLIRGEEKFSTEAKQLLSKSDAAETDTCNGDRNRSNKCAESTSNFSCKR